MTARALTIAITATHQEWAPRLSAWIADHGEQVRLREDYLSTRSDALEQAYDCLIVGAEWSALDSGLVRELHRAGRVVLGVADPASLDGRVRLERLGVDSVLDALAAPADLLAAVLDAAQTRHAFDAVVEGLDGEHAAAGRGPNGPAAVDHGGPIRASSCLTVVTGACEGDGATELAVEIAAQLCCRRETVVLVDADLIAPSIAQRLALPFDVNLHDAVDAVVHGSGDLLSALVRAPVGGFDVIVGLEHPAKWVDVAADDLLSVMTELRLLRGHLVVNVGSQLEALPCGRHRVARGLVAAADRVIVAATATPTGAQRLTRWLVDASTLTELDRICVAANRTRNRHMGGQMASEILRTAAVAGVWGVPEHCNVPQADWAGQLVRSRRYRRAVAHLVAAALPRTLPPERRWRGGVGR